MPPHAISKREREHLLTEGPKALRPFFPRLFEQLDKIEAIHSPKTFPQLRRAFPKVSKAKATLLNTYKKVLPRSSEDRKDEDENPYPPHLQFVEEVVRRRVAVMTFNELGDHLGLFSFEDAKVTEMRLKTAPEWAETECWIPYVEDYLKRAVITPANFPTHANLKKEEAYFTNREFKNTCEALEEGEVLRFQTLMSELLVEVEICTSVYDYSVKSFGIFWVANQLWDLSTHPKDCKLCTKITTSLLRYLLAGILFYASCGNLSIA